MRLTFVLTSSTFAALLLAQQPSTQPGNPHPYVQISSVTADPSVLHRVGEPSTATVTVQVFSSGIDKITDPQIEVSLVTYSSTPPGSKVQILEGRQKQTVHVTPTVFTFKVHVTSETLPSAVTVQALVSAATRGVAIHDPDAPEYGRVEIKIE